jgi:outer membrane lipoprotein-sorting protein
MYVKLVILCILGVLSSAGQVFADARDDVLSEISRQQQQLRTITADFEQVKVSSVFNNPLYSKGWMLYSKPDLLRWQYTGANGVLLRDGKVFQITVSQDGGEVLSAADSAANMLVNYIMQWVKLEFDALEKDYEIHVIQVKPITIALRPRNADAGKFLNMITIEFMQDSPAAHRVVLQEPGGDLTTITFTDPQINIPVLAK